MQTSRIANEVRHTIQHTIYNHNKEMDLSESEINEANEVADLMFKIDEEWNGDYITSLSSEIIQHQPFLLSVLAGIRLEITEEELEEILKIYFLIWESFRNNKNVLEKKLTETDFNRVFNKQVDFSKKVFDKTKFWRTIVSVFIRFPGYKIGYSINYC